MTEEKRKILKGVVEAVEEIREIAKHDIAKYWCHVIKQEHLKEIFEILQTLKNILQNISETNEAFEKAYIMMMEMILSYNMGNVSRRFEDEFLPLLEECIQELGERITSVSENKRTIKILYTDFYPEFEPEKHWLYQLLAKKYNVVFSEQPDYLFFSCFGTRYLQYDCIRIFISNEAVYPNFNLYDYAVTYADFKVTDRLLPNRDAFEHLNRKQIAVDRKEAGKLLDQKTQFCNFVYSNKEGDPFRKELFEAVSSYKPVVAGGKFLNNTGYLVDNLEEFQSHFKFSIACENSFYKGYTTEKIINAFNAGTVPIYWGNSDVTELINPKAVINCHDYPDMQSIVEEIRRLDSDDEAYLEKLTQPILRDENLVEEYLAEREHFIYAIIDQPYAKAFRRNRGLRGQWYNDWFCYALGYPNEWFTEEKGYFVVGRQVGEDGPLVSILIPVYNRREIAKEAINSALNQTWVNTEIIVVDNCSTDGTYEELQKYYGNHPKIKLFQNTENIGPVNNWRVCLEKASGKYVKILWSDDLIRSDFVEKCVNVMEKDSSIGMVYSSCFIFENDDIDTGSYWYVSDRESGVYNKQIFYEGMFQKEETLPVSPGCAMFRREDVVILDDIPNDMGINCNANGAGIDLMIFLQALSKHENYYYYKDVMSFFRYHSGSITATNNLTREYNLAKVFFCTNYEEARPYLPYMKMRILRDEGVKDDQEGVDILTRYRCMEIVQ